MSIHCWKAGATGTSSQPVIQMTDVRGKACTYRQLNKIRPEQIKRGMQLATGTMESTQLFYVDSRRQMPLMWEQELHFQGM